MTDTNNNSNNNMDKETRPFPPSPFDEAPIRRPHLLDNRVPSYICFVSANRDVLTFEVEPTMMVGRRNSLKDMEVVVDLSEFDAYLQGVSRLHAMILTLDDRVTIKDMNSLNGTRLNNLDLKPSQEYPLQDGDTLSFGKLTFTVAFIYS